MSRYRMITPPEKAFAPQIGWIYEQRPLRRTGWVKLRLVELPDRAPFSTVFDITVRDHDLGRCFEPVTDGSLSSDPGLTQEKT